MATAKRFLDQMGWPNEFWEIEESEHCGFKLWSGQTTDFKIDTYHFLTRHPELIG